MSKKSLKASIQATIKENILHEKWTDVIPQVASGIANAGRNIAGQYSLGGIDKRFQRVAQRIEKDWNDSADEIANKANKLANSKNQMIAKQAQMTLAKVDNIDKQINQAMQILQAPVDASLKQGSAGDDERFIKHQAEKDFDEWLKNSGRNPITMSKASRDKWHNKWAQMKSLGLDPKNISLEDSQREIAIASHRQRVSMADLNKRLKSSNEFGIGLGPEYGFQEGGDSNEEDGDGEEDISASIPPPPSTAAKRNPNFAGPQSAEVNAATKPGGGDIRQQIQQKQQQAKLAGGPVPGQAPPNAPSRAPQSPQGPSYEDAGIPSLDQKKASGGNVGAGKATPAAPPSPPGMRSPSRQKGQAAPPPLDLSKYQKVSPPLNPTKGAMGTPTQFAPEKRQKGEVAPPPGSPSKEPIPLTKLKPHRKPETMEMPPREEIPPGKAVPSSIKGMLPPIKDDGEQIQVGSEEKPAVSPRNDTLQTNQAETKPKKKPSAKKKTKK